MDTHTHIHTHRTTTVTLAAHARRGLIMIGAHAHVWPRNHDVGRSKFVMATFLSPAVRREIGPGKFITLLTL